MRAIIDTNIPIIANNQDSPKPNNGCVKECIETLINLQNRGKIILDYQWEIIREYQNKLTSRKPVRVGDLFLRWVLTNRKNKSKCELHDIPLDPEREGNYLHFPKDPDLETFDRNDRKFVALAVAASAPIYTAADSDWNDYSEEFTRNNIKIKDLCPSCSDPRSIEKIKRTRNQIIRKRNAE
jgi:hypothetical protein